MGKSPPKVGFLVSLYASGAFLAGVATEWEYAMVYLSRDDEQGYAAGAYGSLGITGLGVMAALLGIGPDQRPSRSYCRKEDTVATFIALLNFTDQGIRNVKESPARFEAFRAMAQELGVTVKSGFWTMGTYDMVVTLEGPEEAVAAVLMKVGSLGNVRSQTLRAFAKDEFARILATMP